MKARWPRAVYTRRIGYEEVNDAEWLARDPPFRLIGSESASQDLPNRGNETRKNDALERLRGRQPGVYS
jgi:hypothetical protein